MEENEILDELMRLVATLEDGASAKIVPMDQGGSPRKYFRIQCRDRNYVATYSPDPEEGACFIRLAQDFRSAGMPVPEVYAFSEDRRIYIQQDLGDRTLFSCLGREDSTECIKDTLRLLAGLQKTPESVWAADCMAGPFCLRQAMWDLNYFKYDYLRPKEIVFDEERLEDDFVRLAGRLVSIPGEFQGFMMRDCQSRNVMVAENGPVFIDFQGGRKGPSLYDAVSFLWQARAGFSKEFRVSMLDFYCDLYCNGDPCRKKEMLSYLDDIVLFRTLQVLGAYGFRGLIQRKSHFIVSIPGALVNLRDVLDSGGMDLYPELKRCAVSLIDESLSDNKTAGRGLRVEIFSFSFKKGYPEDRSGNGGGFMFDCRSLHNPGRYEMYRKLTGRDREVIDFLERKGEIQSFLRNAWSLVDPAIERYVRRGFTNLQIGFGCTGGQHRSVYSAERTAEHVRSLFPEVEVKLVHRELS